MDSENRIVASSRAFTVAEAAVELARHLEVPRISAQRVRKLLADGRLVGHKVGRDWSVYADSIASFQRRRPGRPRKH